MSDSNPAVNQGFIRWGLPCLVLGLVVGAFAGAYVVPILTGPAQPSVDSKSGTRGAANPREDRPRDDRPRDDRTDDQADPELPQPDPDADPDPTDAGDGAAQPPPG